MSNFLKRSFHGPFRNGCGMFLSSSNSEWCTEIFPMATNFFHVPISNFEGAQPPLRHHHRSPVLHLKNVLWFLYKWLNDVLRVWTPGTKGLAVLIYSEKQLSFKHFNTKYGHVMDLWHAVGQTIQLVMQIPDDPLSPYINHFHQRAWSWWIQVAKVHGPTHPTRFLFLAPSPKVWPSCNAMRFCDLLQRKKNYTYQCKTKGVKNRSRPIMLSKFPFSFWCLAGLVVIEVLTHPQRRFSNPVSRIEEENNRMNATPKRNVNSD